VTLAPLIAAQCSGAFVLARLGLLKETPACTDESSKAGLQAIGIDVLDRPFVARGNIATAGGCLASHYLAAWVIARLEGVEAARSAIEYVAPAGEQEAYVERALKHILPHLLSTPSPRVRLTT
jgi:transcriptional regulator GlxA family with amidase domain